MRFAVLDAAGLWPKELLLANQILILGMPFAATRTASTRTFLLGWHWWCGGGRKALKTRSSRLAAQRKRRRFCCGCSAWQSGDSNASGGNMRVSRRASHACRHGSSGFHHVARRLRQKAFTLRACSVCLNAASAALILDGIVTQNVSLKRISNCG